MTWPSSLKRWKGTFFIAFEVKIFFYLHVLDKCTKDTWHHTIFNWGSSLFHMFSVVWSFNCSSTSNILIYPLHLFPIFFVSPIAIGMPEKRRLFSVNIRFSFIKQIEDTVVSLADIMYSPDAPSVCSASSQNFLVLLLQSHCYTLHSLHLD